MGEDTKSESDVNHYHETQQNTARIARTVGKVLICRSFLRSILLLVIACHLAVSPAFESIGRLSPV